VGFAQRIGDSRMPAREPSYGTGPASAWRENHLANVAPFGKEAMGVTGPC
jgi:hypothetical protein